MTKSLYRAIILTLFGVTLSTGVRADPPDAVSRKHTQIPRADTTIVPSDTAAHVNIPGLTPVVGRDIRYVVKPGEDLYTLGVRYRLAIEHLMWANGLAGLQAKAGTKITIPLRHVLPATLEEGLVINLPERGVYLFKNHEYVAFYPCAIGMGGRFATPTGDTKIVTLQINPTWSPPDWAGIKEAVPPGPNNPLGDRWIGLGINGVGLHGTTQPLSVGQAASHGCMRMYPSVVRILFEQVKVGMPTRVIYEPIKLGIDPQHNKIYVQIFPDVYGRIPDRAALLRGKLERAGLSDLVDDEQIRRLLADRSTTPRPLLGDDVVIKVNGRKVLTTPSPFLREGQILAPSDVLRAIGADVHYRDKVLTVTLKGNTVRLTNRSRPSPTEGSIATPPQNGDSPAKQTATVPQNGDSPAKHTATVPHSGDSPAKQTAPPPPAEEPKTGGPVSSPRPGATMQTPPISPTPLTTVIETLSYGPRLWNGKSFIPVKPILNSFHIPYKWNAEHKTLLISCPDKDASP